MEGITAIEQAGYQRLVALGATPPTCIYSVGGGSQNAQWTTLRSNLLKLPMRKPRQVEAAYGAALLAKHPMTDQAKRERKRRFAGVKC